MPFSCLTMLLTLIFGGADTNRWMWSSNPTSMWGDTVAVLVGYLLEDGLQIRVDSVLEHLATVFRTPDDVVV